MSTPAQPDPPGPPAPTTVDRLLEAAAEVFAQHGYRNASVREICRKAGANVAAVNYHFGDKGGLYAQVLLQQMRRVMARYPLVPPPAQGATPGERLRFYIRAFLMRLLDQDQHARHGQLIAREMFEPSEAFEKLLADFIKPNYAALQAIVRDLAGRAADDATVARCGLSVAGQVLIYFHGRVAVQRLAPPPLRGEAELDRLVDHITSFSLAGIRAAVPRAARSRQGPARPAR